MTGGGEAPDAQTTAEPAAAAPQWNAKEWEFDWNGKKVAPDSREKALTWIQQGHNYSQRVAEINQREKAWQQQKAEIEGRYKGWDRYADVDKYARENPQWWEHVEKSWQSRGQQQEAAGAVPQGVEQFLKPLQEKLTAQEQFLEQLRQEREQQEQRRYDEALSTEIGSIRETHPNIDFDSVDESGKTLEARIVEHGVAIGTSSFRAAFRDLLFDQLQESVKAQKLAAEVKGEKAQKAAGILGTSPTPRKGPDAPFNHRGRSYDDITQMVLSQEGLS